MEPIPLAKLKPQVSAVEHIIPAINREERVRLVKALVDSIKKSEIEFDSIVCMGVSGLLIAPTVAMVLDKEFAVVRKQGDNTHSGRRVEGFSFVQRYLIVDDLVDTGASIKRIQKEIAAFTLAESSLCVGVFCYNGSYCMPEKTALDGPPIYDCSIDRETPEAKLTIRSVKPKQWNPMAQVVFSR